MSRPTVAEREWEWEWEWGRGKGGRAVSGKVEIGTRWVGIRMNRCQRVSDELGGALREKDKAGSAAVRCTHVEVETVREVVEDVRHCERITFGVFLCDVGGAEAREDPKVGSGF